MGFDAECTKRATSAFAAGSASVSADTPIGSAGAQTSFQASANDMAESGCGQFAANIQDVSTRLANLNCTIQDNQSSSSVTQTGTATIRLETQSPTGEQLAILEQARAGQQASVDLAKANLSAFLISPGFSESRVPFFQKMIDDSQATLQETLEKISPPIKIIDSQVLNISNQTLKSEVTMTDTQETQIEEDIKAVATQAAEQKLRQQLGVNALTPNAKQLVKSKVDNNTPWLILPF
jgi:hypothetical protein